MSPSAQPPLRTATLDGPSWDAVVALVRGEPGPDPDVAAALRAGGLLTATGELDPNWHLAVYEFLTAPLTFDVSATWADLGQTATVALGPRTTTSLTRRFTLAREGTGWRTTGVDPLVELAVTGPGHSWPLVSRALPLRDALRTEPRQTPEPEKDHHPLDEATARALVAALASGAPLPDLPPAIADAVATDCAVSVTVMTRDAEGAILGVGNRQWTLGEEGLYQIRVEDGEAVVTEVEPGDVGFTVVWLTMGALDLLDHAAAPEGAR